MGRAPCCDKANVKKGPWSPEEDAKLKSFIEQNGTGGNWITLPSKAGLKRCGKSCRLRWINYLRPDIKHGSFTEDEEKTIYRLHAQIGSSACQYIPSIGKEVESVMGVGLLWPSLIWSLIAAQLPGRTDNDIKNYWNTRLKKKLVDRGNAAAAAHYGRFHPYQQIHLINQLGLQDQMASAAAREGLLHGQQHSYTVSSMNQQHSYYQDQLYQQQQYLQQQMQRQQHLQSSIQLPTVLQHQHQMRIIKNEMVDEGYQQSSTFVGPSTSGVAVDEAERERLMVIESSLRRIIVDEAATGSGSSRGLPVNNMQARLASPMAPHVASPSSSCSNLSSDRNAFGGAQIPDSNVRYNGYEDTASLRDAAISNTSILGPQPPQVSTLQNAPASTHGSLLGAPRFDDGGEDGNGAGPGDWWNIDLVSPPRHNSSSSSRAATILPPSLKWGVLAPRCGSDIYTSPLSQTQLGSQSHGLQPLDTVDGMNSYTDSYFSKLIV